MLRAAGYQGREGAEAFKRETLLDIISCDYATLQGITTRINAYTSQTRSRTVPSQQEAHSTAGG